MIIQAVRTIIKSSTGVSDYQDLKRMTDYVRSMGVLALVVGILGQLLGLYGAFEYIQEVGAVSQTMLVSGIKVSMITTIYGIIILIVGLIFWMLLDGYIKKNRIENSDD
jgi:biopolymer transport protein ExbB/TolQ